MSEQQPQSKSHFLPKEVGGAHVSSNERAIRLDEIFYLINKNKWFILALMLVGFLIAYIYAGSLLPQYESTALIQVKSSSTSMSGGEGNGGAQASGEGGVVSFGMMTSGGSGVVEEALLKSRFILQPAIEDLGLNIVVSYQYYPLFGAFLARHYKGIGVAKPILGLKQYAWGGEKITVRQFIVPLSYENKLFKGIVGEGGIYKIYDMAGHLLLTGKAGYLTSFDVANGKSGMKIFIPELKANPGLIFYIQVRPAFRYVKQLSNSIDIDDMGRLAGIVGGDSGGTGVLQITLRGTDAAFLPISLNTILNYEIQKNVAKKVAEIEQTLNFLEQQSTILRQELNGLETDFVFYEVRHHIYGTHAGNDSALLNQLVETSKSIEMLKLQKLNLLRNYTEQHPFLIALNQQQQYYQKQLDSLQKQASGLPKTEQEMLDLQRELRVKEQLYVFLLNQTQQLEINKAGLTSDVAILGDATPAVPLGSATLVILLFGIAVSFVGALAIVLLRYFLTHEIEDPDYLEERLKVPLYAIVPYSRRQVRLVRNLKNFPASLQNPAVLAAVDSKDLAIEGLRSLRTVLQLHLQEAKNNIVAILGANPALGKSFISLNLAYVLADSGQKVLLVDADLRKGKIHKYFGLTSAPGFAEILAGKNTFISAKKTVREGSVDFVSSGTTPENPAELMHGKGLQKFLDKVSSQYDIVILDTPPVLLVADGIIAAKYAGTHLLVLGPANGSIREIERAKKKLEKNNLHLDGFIYNSTKTSVNSGYHKYGSYYEDRDKDQS